MRRNEKKKKRKKKEKEEKKTTLLITNSNDERKNLRGGIQKRSTDSPFPSINLFAWHAWVLRVLSDWSGITLHNEEWTLCFTLLNLPQQVVERLSHSRLASGVGLGELEVGGSPLLPLQLLLPAEEEEAEVFEYSRRHDKQRRRKRKGTIGY